MEWLLHLPNPLGMVLNLFAQGVGGDVDGSDTLITSLISAIGGAGLSTAILWRIHAEDRKVINSLTSRLFLLADRGMAVGQTASEVAKGDTTDPRVLLVLERLEAELDTRGDT